MANVKFLVRNAIAQAGVVLMNGTGGGAPALDEDADWPMSHLLSPDRETYWRTSPVPPEPIQVDFDLGSAQSIVASGIAKLRLFSANLVEGGPYVLYYDNVYPPTNDAGVGGSMTMNNNFDEFGAISARYWRFEIYSGGGFPFGCKLWLVKSADKIDLGKNWYVGTDESAERLREVVTSPAGLSFAFEPGQNRGSTIRSGRFVLRQQLPAIRDSLRDQLTTIDTRFVALLGDGTAIETALPEGNFPWSRAFGSPESFDFEIPLQEHP